MNDTAMIVLFTDFGIHDPYVGQLKAVLTQAAPQIPVIDLLHQVPNGVIQLSWTLTSLTPGTPLAI